MLDGLDGPGMRAALPGLFATLDALRDIGVSGTRGYGIWTPDGTAPAPGWAQALLSISDETPRVPGWRAALAASPVGMKPFDRAYDLLQDLSRELPDERHMIHGDLLNRNVLIAGSKITAVIDWGNALYGDWLYDAAWLIYWWSWFPQWGDIDIAAELERHWEQHGGLPRVCASACQMRRMLRCLDLGAIASEGLMRRRRVLFWTTTGSVVAAVAVVISLILASSGAPPKTASSPVPSISARASSPAGESAPVVVPPASTTSSFSYLADLNPSGDLSGLVIPGPVKISGSIYPKSISFYCRNGDPAATPEYKLRRSARRFQATIGLEADASPNLQVSVIMIGDGRTLRTFSVSVLRPRTVDVDVTGVRTFRLECFGTGMTPRSGGWAVPLAWGNARVSGGH